MGTSRSHSREAHPAGEFRRCVDVLDACQTVRRFAGFDDHLIDLKGYKRTPW